MHDLGHSMASNMVNSGRSIDEVAKVLGYTQLKTQPPQPRVATGGGRCSSPCHGDQLECSAGGSINANLIAPCAIRTEARALFLS